MSFYKKEFRMGHYVRAIEKSLHYMCAVFLALAIISFCIYIPDSSNPAIKISELLNNILLNGDPDGNLPKVFRMIIGVLSALPYFFYYTLKDNREWNLYSGKKDLNGLIKIYVLYEIYTIGLFYLLLPQGDYVGSKLITAAIGFLLVLIYIVILFFQHKKGEDIGYFLILVILLGLGFALLIYKNASVLGTFEGQNYDSMVYLLLFMMNSFINIIFLHKFDSCAETGIISNRIKIIIPTITYAVFTPSVTYCYLCDNPKYVTMMLAVAAGITSYEVIISLFRTQKTNAKVFGCVGSFAVFVSGIALFIWNWNFTDNDYRKKLVEYWFLLIGMCIYLVAIKYYGAIVKLQFPKESGGKSKGKIMCDVIWLRNGLLGSMLFLLVIYTFTNSHFGMTIGVIFSASLAEFFIYQYVFNIKRDLQSRKSYLIGRTVEMLVILLPLAFFILEKWYDFRLEKYFGNNPAILVLFVMVTLLIIVAGLYMYILSKYNKGEWEKIPEVDRVWFFRELWMRFRDINNKTYRTLRDKNVEDFWMALLCWGFFIALASLSLFSCVFGIIHPEDVKSVLLWGGTEISFAVFSVLFLTVIVGVDLLFLSRNLFSYYMKKMEEGEMVKKFQDVFRSEWKKCIQEMSAFKESDAKLFLSGSYYRPLLFFFGAIYQPEVSLEGEEINRFIAKAACCIELLHKSDTIIDDYIDEDASRDGQESFHVQYNDTKKMILLRDALHAKALMLLASCRNKFLCDKHLAAFHMELLSQNLYDLSSGRYQELSLADYDRIGIKDLEQVVLQETLSLFRNSIKLGYNCFHERQGDKDGECLESLAVTLGRFYQYMNDREPFVKTVQYQKFKGAENNIGKKNMVMLKLYERFADAHPEEKDRKEFLNSGCQTKQKWYKEYCLDEEILQEAENKINEMRNILQILRPGNELWCKSFEAMFNAMLSERGWRNQLREL